MIDINKYKTIFMDCDGVILDSNAIKTNAYFKVVYDEYGDYIASEITCLQVKNPHFNRYEMFDNLFIKILHTKINTKKVNELVKFYGDRCKEELLEANETYKVKEFLSSLEVPVYVITGSNQEDTKYILDKKGFSFNGVYGCPENKVNNINYLFRSNIAERPVLFIGDSEYDYTSAMECEVDFIFMSQYTDFHDYDNYFVGKNVEIINNLSDLL